MIILIAVSNVSLQTNSIFLERITFSCRVEGFERDGEAAPRAGLTFRPKIAASQEPPPAAAAGGFGKPWLPCRVDALHALGNCATCVTAARGRRARCGRWASGAAWAVGRLARKGRAGKGR